MSNVDIMIYGRTNIIFYNPPLTSWIKEHRQIQIITYFIKIKKRREVGDYTGLWTKCSIICHVYMGLILKCNPIRENTKHLRSCTR